MLGHVQIRYSTRNTIRTVRRKPSPCPSSARPTINTVKQRRLVASWKITVQGRRRLGCEGEGDGESE